MSAALHSPAPWSRDGRGHIVDANGRLIGIVVGDLAEGPQHADANAALVLAAPELLKSLVAAEREIRALTASMGSGVMTDPTLAMMGAAIAKATGAAS